RRANLRRDPDSTQSQDVGRELIWHLGTASRQQVWSATLNDVDRYTAHHTYHTADLEATEHVTGPTFIRITIALAERQIIHAIHLEIVRAIVAGGTAVTILRGQKLNPRALIVVRKVDCLGPGVGRAEKRTGPTTSKERLERIIIRRSVRLNRV